MVLRSFILGLLLFLVTACTSSEGPSAFDTPPADGPASNTDDADPVIDLTPPDMTPVENVDLDRDYTWMAEELDFLEKRRVSLVNCMDDAGFPGTQISPDGLEIRGGSLNPDDDPNFDTGSALNKWSEALGECQEQTPYQVDEPDDASTLDAYLEIYDSLLDTMACVSELGYEITNPPARDVWAERVFEINNAIENDLITDRAQLGNLTYESENAWSSFNEIRKQVFAGEITQTAEEYGQLTATCIDNWGSTWDPTDPRIP